MKTSQILEEKVLEKEDKRTPCDESQKQKETTTLKLLLGLRNINIGTWSVRTMYEAGKTAHIAAEMRNCNLTLLGISETKWIQSGQ